MLYDKYIYKVRYNNIKSDHKMTIRSMSIHWVGRHTFISFISSHDSLIFSNAFFFSLELGHHD
jgi:hypothetical protein